MNPRVLLALAATAVALGAADTYVVVLALPDMMTGVGLSIDQLQQAAPIVSAFLLGYIALQPLLGRIVDLRGRTPVLIAGLVLFAIGSLVTTLSPDLGAMVVGRFFQGLGGGALVPATMALVADLYPPQQRGGPLGMVSAVQELGSVLGPLIGAVILGIAGWRGIFGVNLALAVLLAVLIGVVAGRRLRYIDPLAVLLALLAVAGMVLVLARPQSILTSLTWGTLYVPRLGSSEWTSYLALGTLVAIALLLARCWWASRPLVDLRSWAQSVKEVDVAGAFWLALALTGVILAFATANPEQAALTTRGWWYLLGAALVTVVLIVHLRRHPNPLLPASKLRHPAAWGAVLASLFIGAALVAALVDVPLFARTTIYSGSQVKASLVLVRLLIAIPVGAVIGGRLIRLLPSRGIAGVGLLLTAAGFVLMARWDIDALHHVSATGPLVLTGFGFGLALAPVTHSLLSATDSEIHGLASSLAVAARMVGMLVGLSVMTTLGLRSYYTHQAHLPTLAQVCPDGTFCTAYVAVLKGAGVVQEHTVFHWAAISAAVAAVLCLVLLRPAPEHATTAVE